MLDTEWFSLVQVKYVISVFYNLYSQNELAITDTLARMKQSLGNPAEIQ